ncbi:cyanophycinase [Sphingobacterium chuzhouense]|uniref:Cyanophycinase n=1 Tax=Sphingobacterium chuzhouense TaxID=1742264 RepID=A0ABR7XVQ6_9SPHI|nr:cyanophycinase [Sphingobacterium chuzhouense]MBD1423130.1 cyanophycinase [Sphingobacterium chuzhouense]
MKTLKLLGLFLLASGIVTAQSPIKIKDSETRHGPERGSLLIIGGSVGDTPSIWNKFVELAGGKEKAKVVVVTAAAGDSSAWDQRHVDQIQKITGIAQIQLLHTASFEEANTEQFVAPLRKATGVYFIGGRQWRIADYYLNTLAHQAFLDVLDRGGILAGSSAGASIQGSFLWRGDTSGSNMLIGDHTQGLSFLKNSVIDQHLLKRNRQFDLVDIVKHTPSLIGIGLDEATAIWVRKDTAEVIGNSYVAIYDQETILGKKTGGPFFFLSHGQKYDLKNRTVIRESSRREREGSLVSTAAH